MHTISTVPTLLFLKFCELWQEVVQKKQKHASSFVLLLTLISPLPSFPSILQRVPSGLVNVFIHIHFSHRLLSNPLQPGCCTGLHIGPSLMDLKHISNILSGAMQTLKIYKLPPLEMAQNCQKARCYCGLFVANVWARIDTVWRYLFLSLFISQQVVVRAVL